MFFSVPRTRSPAHNVQGARNPFTAGRRGGAAAAAGGGGGGRMSWFRRRSSKSAPAFAVPSPSAAPHELPELVIVGTAKDLARAGSVFEPLASTELTLGVYNPTQAATPEFKQAFRIGPPGAHGPHNPPFQPRVLYRRHLDPREAKYYPFYEFDFAMDQAKYNEMIDIAQHIRAHVVLIDGSTLDEARRARERGLNVFVPAAAASGGIVSGLLGSSDVVTAGAGRTSSKASEQTRERGFLVCFESQEPKPDSALPPGDVIPEGWYFYQLSHGQGGFKGTPFAKLVTTAMQGDYRTRSLEINFASEDHSLAARAVCYEAGVKILAAFEGRADTDRTPSSVAGSGYSFGNTDYNARKVHYKFKIEMFDQDVYTKLKRLSRTEQTDMNERIRRSSGHTATLRWNNYRIQTQVRQDLKFIGATAVPSGETNQRRGRWCFGDYVRGVLEGEGDNYVNIPITVYGLEGEGKSSVLGTWFSSSRDSPYTFVDKTHTDYRDRVTKDSWRSHVASTIITDIKFESVNVGREAEGHELDQQWDSVDGNKAIARPGTARLVMRDTPPAISPTEDTSGDALPDGLLVLVVDATKVNTAAGAERWSELVPGGTYPPMACILAKTNMFADSRVEELVKWMRDNLSIKHVIPMRTFQVLSTETRRVYLDAEVMSLQRKEFNADWKKTSMSALNALEALVEVIKSNEVMNIKMVLGKEGDNESWWKKNN
jgi:hypothetical protein